MLALPLRMAIAHPELVRKLVIISTPFKRDGWYPEVLSAMAKLGPAAAEGMKQSPLSKLYPGVNWGVLFTKLADLLKRDYDWSKEVAALKATTLLVFADADSVRPGARRGILRTARRRQEGCGAGWLRTADRTTRDSSGLHALQHSELARTQMAIITAFLDARVPKK